MMQAVAAAAGGRRRWRHQHQRLASNCLTQIHLLVVLSISVVQEALFFGAGRRGALQQVGAPGPSTAASHASCSREVFERPTARKRVQPCLMQPASSADGLVDGVADRRAAVASRSGRCTGGCHASHSPRESRQGSPQPAPASGARLGQPQVTIAIFTVSQTFSERGEARRAR